jgi:hypothetical protein
LIIAAAPIFESNAPILLAFAAPPASYEAFRFPSQEKLLFPQRRICGWQGWIRPFQRKTSELLKQPIRVDSEPVKPPLHPQAPLSPAHFRQAISVRTQRLAGKNEVFSKTIAPTSPLATRRPTPLFLVLSLLIAPYAFRV